MLYYLNIVKKLDTQLVASHEMTKEIKFVWEKLPFEILL